MSCDYYGVSPHQELIAIFFDHPVVVLNYDAELDAFGIYNDGTSSDVRIVGGKITWIGCICPECGNGTGAEYEPESLDRLNIERRAPQIIEACGLFRTIVMTRE